MRDLSVWSLCLRLLAAAFVGGVLGFERELRAQPAGMRTHALVAVGAALFTIAGAYGFADVTHGPNVDPARLAAQVASGIGFLGAGAILRDRMGIRGLTTAATLWLAAALGVTAGAGSYDAVLVGGVVVLLLLVALRLLKPILIRAALRTSVVEVEYDRGHGTLGPVLRSLRDARVRIQEIDVVDDGEEHSDGVRHVSVLLSTHDGDHLRELVDALEDRPEVHAVRVRPPGGASGGTAA